MKTKLVNRYYCDHCNKGGCSASHMRRHEKRCTLNPSRECGVCKYVGREQPAAESLASAIVEDIREHELRIASWEIHDAVVERVLVPRLDAAAGGCPACMLAAIRQHGGDYIFDFDYQSAAKPFFDARAA
jgi:hypothetical protein